MRLAIWKGLAFGAAVGACAVVAVPAAHAQSVFCPTAVMQQSGIAVSNGACTNGQVGSFSGAALASQALSSLSQTTTQETTRSSITSITERRTQEEQRCAEGFTRVDGTCRRTRPETAEEAPAAAPPPPAKKPAAKKAKKAKAAGAPAEEEAPPPPTAKVVAPQVIPPPLLPVPVEPGVRVGSWTQLYGDYEKRSATGQATVQCCVGAGIATPLPLTIGVQSRTGTVGFQAGADLTTRGVLTPGDGLVAGVLVGYLSTNLILNEQALSSNFAQAGNEFAHLGANLTGPTGGVYATYFNNGFSADVLFKADVLDLSETFQDSLAFCIPCFGAASFVPVSGSGSTSLINATVAANLNYRFDLYPNMWIEPTVGAQYTNTTYSAGAAQLGLDDGSLVMVQGGARFGFAAPIGSQILMTTTLTGLAYSDVLVKGGFIPGAGFEGNNILAKADQGQVRGRGVFAFNFDLGGGVSSFVLGEARGGQGLFGAGGKAGVRIVW